MKRELKDKAQDEIMQALSNAILIMEERGPYEGNGKGNTELADAMRKEASRIGKRFGFDHWPGIM